MNWTDVISELWNSTYKFVTIVAACGYCSAKSFNWFLKTKWSLNLYLKRSLISDMHLQSYSELVEVVLRPMCSVFAIFV